MFYSHVHKVQGRGLIQTQVELHVSTEGPEADKHKQLQTKTTAIIGKLEHFYERERDSTERDLRKK